MNNQTIDINTEYEIEVNQDYGDYELCPDCKEYTIRTWHEPNGTDDYNKFGECSKCGAMFSE